MNQPESTLDPRKVLDVVARRADVIAHLMDEPKHKCDLEDELGVSRSTVYKALRELEGSFVVERTEEGYRPTLMGRLLFSEYERFRTTVEDIARPGRLLSTLPTDCDVDAALLEGAEFVVPERHAPSRPVAAFEELVNEASVLKGLLPVVQRHYVEVFRDGFADGCRAELVLERPAAESLRADYPETFDALCENGDLTITETDERLPFELLVAEEPTPLVRVTVYDAMGGIRGVITNDSAAAVEWGRTFWRQQEEGSTETTPEPSGAPIEGGDR